MQMELIQHTRSLKEQEMSNEHHLVDLEAKNEELITLLEKQLLFPGEI